MGTTTLFNEVEVAEAYARHRDTTDKRFIDQIADLLGPPGFLVDVGAGIGGPARRLIDRGFRVVAVEPSPAMIAVGRDRLPPLTYVQAVGEAMPLPDTSFDAATVLYVLHHCDDPEELLREAKRVVRPGGRIVVVSGSEDCARQRFFSEYFPTLRPDLPDTHELSVYARAAGLDVVDVQKVDHWVYPNRAVDEAYCRMVSTEMFAALRSLNEPEFRRGLARLRADVGRPIPPSEATLVVCGGP